MRDGKQQAKIALLGNKIQPETATVWRLESLQAPWCFSEGKVKNKAGFSELSASSQHLGKTYLLTKNWGWPGRGAIKGYTPALLLSQPPKEILSSLFKGLEVIKVWKDRLFSEQGLLKWHHGLLCRVYQWLQSQCAQSTVILAF